MSVLVPLYLAGLAALSLPVIFHLVRRTPRGRQVFSSLMFLAPTPPQLTRRSRLDQILLLILRLAALLLLAFAFARPFLREAASLSFGDLPGRRVAILLDTSASMRRGKLWQEAVAIADREIGDLNPQDDVALYTFSERLQTVVDFQKEGDAPIADKPHLARQRLKGLRPTWEATDLGSALVAVAREFDAAADAQAAPDEPLILVVSDFQKGSRIEALQNYEWPKQVRVVPRPVAPAATTNAYARVLSGEEEAEASEIRVRVVNVADSKGDQFYLSWIGDGAAIAKKRPRETAVYVPPGQSRVVRMPRGDDELQADKVVLRGDDHDFDNTFFVVPPRKQDVTLLYAGSDAADDPQGLQYYLRLAVASDPLRQVEVRPLKGSDDLLPAGATPQLVVVSQTLEGHQHESLRAYVVGGGTLLLVPKDREAAAMVPAFLDDVEVAAGGESSEAAEEYLLLGQIDFTHPLFSPFASPRYSDFTKIHFWQHRALALKSPATTQVVARFDNGDPAVLERVNGKGRILALASGWHPDDSQLALSSKFVPLVGGILDQACGGDETAASLVVNEPLTLTARKSSAAMKVIKPGRQDVALAADAAAFSATDEPGIYRLESAAAAQAFAVNLAAAESDTAPLAMEQLEQRGVPFGKSQSRAERMSRVRQQRDTELESRQKIWRWLIVGVLGVVIFETWWGGRAARAITKREDAR